MAVNVRPHTGRIDTLYASDHRGGWAGWLFRADFRAEI
jgi:hypothetical protein